MAIRDGKLLASFQIGERITDIRVFRWSISSDGSEVRYIDNRGERDIALPAPFDFEWQRATREMVVEGRFPHLNILDTLFVETIGGDLTIKVENNTEVGLGIYREEVMDKTQSLDDAQVEFACLGSLLLLKVLPYREEQWRYLVFNSLTGKVERIDAIGLACIQLPEDHGIIFPGGYYLQNGEYRTFEQSMEGMRFKRSVRSPNGEDVQYVFYHPEQGRNVLLTYNLINRQLQNPLFGHGYARLEDGRMVIFAAEGGNRPASIRCRSGRRRSAPRSTRPANRRVAVSSGGSAMPSWCAASPTSTTCAGRSRLRQFRSSATRCCARTPSACSTSTTGSAATNWTAWRRCCAKWRRPPSWCSTNTRRSSIRRQSAQAMVDAEERHKALLSGLLPDGWDRVQQFVDGLNGITAQRGLLLTIREYRYIDVARLDAMEAELLAAHERVAAATATFLASEQALQPLLERLQSLDGEAQKAETVAQLGEPLAALEAMAGDLDMLSSLMASLRIDDATQRTRIIESISEIYARLNQAKARAEQRRKGLGSSETVAQFGAQFKLFGQGITNALAQAQDPERCDEQLSRLLVQLEELESQFGDHEQFLGDILAKREELLETFEAHKQTLLDERQRKAQGLLDAARRILDSLQRRTARFTQAEELNAFFAADPLILKLRELAERLRELKDSVKADDVEARLKAARDQAVRALRDKSELFEEGGDVIRLGPRHRFSVNTQELDLTLMRARAVPAPDRHRFPRTAAGPAAR